MVAENFHVNLILFETWFPYSMDSQGSQKFAGAVDSLDALALDGAPAIIATGCSNFVGNLWTGSLNVSAAPNTHAQATNAAATDLPYGVPSVCWIGSTGKLMPPHQPHACFLHRDTCKVCARVEVCAQLRLSRCPDLLAVCSVAGGLAGC